MLDVKNSSRESLKLPVAERDEVGPAESREGHSEMVIVIGVVAVAAMIFGFVLGLLL